MSMSNTRNDGLTRIITAVTVFVIFAAGASVGALLMAML